MRLIVLSAVLFLSACVHQRQQMTPEQQADAIIANFGPICEKLGYQPYTDPWRGCVLSRYDSAMQEASARRAAAIGAYGARPRNCTFMGNTMMCN